MCLITFWGQCKLLLSITAHDCETHSCLISPVSGVCYLLHAQAAQQFFQKKREARNVEFVGKGKFPGQNSSVPPTQQFSNSVKPTHPLPKHQHEGRVIPQKYSLLVCMFSTYSISSHFKQHNSWGSVCFNRHAPQYYKTDIQMCLSGLHKPSSVLGSHQPKSGPSPKERVCPHAGSQKWSGTSDSLQTHTHAHFIFSKLLDLGEKLPCENPPSQHCKHRALSQIIWKTGFFFYVLILEKFLSFIWTNKIYGMIFRLPILFLSKRN